MISFISAASIVLLLGYVLGRLSLDDNLSSTCKIMPGDAKWPSQKQWDVFNATIDGALIRTIPIGSPCHNPMFDVERCALVRSQWHTAKFHEQSSSSVMAALFANKSCDPFTDVDDQCVVGTYVQYAVNVSKPVHVIRTIQFVKEHNIRFVVRNTGHDYMGKSTGAGALAVWMHHIQDREWTVSYLSETYNGPAVKAYAGVTGEMLYEDAAQRGYAIVAGECPTVGFAGGYIQGGGHSVLASTYGLAADQALAFEVITTEGKFVQASPTMNSDLFWALSGGGGGTYGIVWSVTVKARVDMPVTLAQLSFTSSNISADTFWEAISAKDLFALGPVFAPGLDKAAVLGLTKPLRTKLNALCINYTFSTTSYSNIRSATLAADAMVGELQVSIYQFGGRLLPRSLWESNDTLASLLGVLKGIVDDGASILDVAIRPTLDAAGHPHNAVLPAWRESERLLLPILPWDDYASLEQMHLLAHKLTWDYGEPLRALTPDSGAYLNEADPAEPQWQTAFYGSNYNSLLKIKDKWDPSQLLYGATAVGGDRWVVQQDGRLCKA
ncbi:FAD binding domain protein [Crucibulum laeve]|uniref:FAD binding domain protein n=1 Tax=Crucibulum laeve TaxID=68775 RepID=A0A5C3M724_9AGAR|nr:FAD binding domain protein [Crucibulum laeve]